MFASHKTLTYKIVAAFMAVMIVLAALPVQTAQAATSILVNWTKAYDQTSLTTNNYSFAIPNGSNRVLVVGIAINTDGSSTVANPTTLTYGNQALTLATSNGSTSGHTHTYLYYLKENSVMDNTSRLLNVTMGAVSSGDTIRNITVWYAVYAGVDQTPTSYTVGNGFTNTDGSGPARLSTAMTVNANQQAVYISNVQDTGGLTLPSYTINANWTSGGTNTGTYNPTGTGSDRAWRIEVANRTMPSTDTTDNATTSAIAPANNIRYAISAMSLPAVSLTAQTITVTTPAPANATYRSTFTVAATASSGLAVTYSSGTPTICTNVGALFTIIAGAGTCTVQYNQAGNGTYSAAPQVTNSVNAQPANLTYTANAASRAYGAANPAFSGTVTGFLNGESQATATTGILAFTTTATIASNVGSYAINGSGLTANNGNYTFVQAAGNTTALTIDQASQSITFGALADKTYGDAPFTVSATGGASGNAVTFSSQTLSTCSVASDTVTILSAGPCTIRASQTGNINYSAATDVDRSFTIAQSASIITFDPAPTPTYLGPDFTANAATTNTDSNVLTYSYVSGPCSFVSGATFHSTGAGSCVVQANGAATTNFNAASQTQSVTIGQATPVITWSNPAGITYGTALSATQLNASTTVSGTFNYTPAAGTVLNAGNGQTLSVDFTSSDPNYKDVPGTTVTINVLQATLTVTATGVNKTYDGTTTATVNLSDDRVAGDAFTEGYTNASFVDANVGTNKHIDVTGISISGGASSNYILAATTASATADILADSTTTVITNAAALATGTVVGQSYPVTFTVTPNTGGTPTGNVTVSDGTDSCTALVSDGTCNLISTTSGVKTLTAAYAGDSNFGGSTSAGVSHTVNEAPAITSLDHATFTVATVGPVFTVTTTGYPAPSITQGSDTLPSGVTFTDNGNGTGTLDGTPASGTMGTYHITFTAANGIGTDAVQNFTLTVVGGPTILTNGVNTAQDTGDGHLDENEIVTINLNKFTVTFSKDVLDVPNTDPNYGESVIDPANYILVNDNGNGFQTVDCKTGVDPQDFAITVDSATYNNHGGEGPFVATLNVNSNNPLANGNYRLYICGTTSITDLGGLKLAGNGTTEGTDFIRNFSVQLPDNGGGDNGGGGNNSGGGTGGFGGFIPVTGLIPVTGFAPDHSTLLPAQPADSAYSSFNNLRMEIPSLGVNVSIVGVAYKDNHWDLTWLGNNAGYLDGSAYPTWSGNSVLTGHVVDAAGAPGPFAYIKDLQIGDKINIHFGGQIFVYEVRENRQVLPTMLSTIFKHEDYSWLTLVTCEDYNNTRKGYNYRRYTRAVLVSVLVQK